MVYYNHKDKRNYQKEKKDMVAVFRTTSGHPFFAVANSKKDAINALYDCFATENQQKWLTPERWWKSLTDSNGNKPFEIHECKVLK